MRLSGLLDREMQIPRLRTALASTRQHHLAAGSCGSSVEVSRIAGHANTKITEEYTVVQLKRQEELTRRIQDRLEETARKVKKEDADPNAPFLHDESLPVDPVPRRTMERPSDAAPVPLLSARKKLVHRSWKR